MNILISGASGYLGSNVAAHLAQEHTISILDRNYEIQNGQSSYALFLYFSNPNEIDFHSNSEEAVIHMVKHFYRIASILESITVSSIVYASTVRVHDDKKNIYATTHLFIENLLENYVTQNQCSLSILRFGNIFGGTIKSMLKRDSLVPHVFIKSVLETKTITLLTNGEQYRDFTPMSYVNQYIDYVIENRPKIVDICTGVNFKIIEIVDIIAKDFPESTTKVSNKNLNETIKNYTSSFNITKENIEKEIRNTIKQWRQYYDSNFR